METAQSSRVCPCLDASFGFPSGVRRRSESEIATAPTRTITIPQDRLAAWIAGFTNRHGEARASQDGDIVALSAVDGARAMITVPFPPLDPSAAHLLDALVGHVSTERRVGAILVRKGGFAVGVFQGSELLASKVGSAYVQGKTKAGGWSQQRYARRRDNQSKKAYAESADEVVRILLPHLEDLDAIVTAGDKAAIAAVLADPRLEALGPKVLPRTLPVPDPRLRVLQAFPAEFLAVRIVLNELA